MAPFWRRLGAVPPQDLVDARVQLHHAVQLVAAVGNALLPTQPDASHKCMTYLPEREALVGKSIVAERPFRVALEIPRLALEILVEDKVHVPRLPLQGETVESALAWLNRELQSLDPECEIVSPHVYASDFPDHAVGQGAPFRLEDPSHLLEIDRYFGNAWHLLNQIARYEAGAGPLRVWPHHFDMAFRIRLDSPGDDARSVGVGFSPGDEGHAEPYGYVTPWPVPPADRLPSDDPPGHWQAEPFYGALLGAGDVFGSGGDQEETILAFTLKSIEVARDLLKD